MMNETNIQSLPDMQAIEAEARTWVARLQDDEVSQADLAEFEAWRKRNALHDEAYGRLSRFWGGVDFVHKLNDYAESDVAVEAMRYNRFVRQTSIVRRVAIGAIAASLIAFVGVGGYDYAFGGNRSFSGEYKTAIGEQETINLPDGSYIVLNTDSAAEVSYTRGARIIHLTKGEAYFDVASNAKRPFSVETEKGVVTAVGTAFSVRLGPEKLDVMVAEGRVALDAAPVIAGALDSGEPEPDAPSPAPRAVVEVSAGQSAIIGRGVEEISMVTPDALDKELDWRDGMLSFDGETLEQVIADISRYTDLKIEISDDALRNQKIIAYYKIGDVERVFEALNVMADIEVERVSEGHVRLTRLN